MPCIRTSPNRPGTAAARERQVLAGVRSGLSNRQIADAHPSLRGHGQVSPEADLRQARGAPPSGSRAVAVYNGGGLLTASNAGPRRDRTAGTTVESTDVGASELLKISAPTIANKALGGNIVKLGRRLEEARAWGSGLERGRKALASAKVDIGHAEVHGVRLRYVHSPGEGQPLLFCNGIGANLEMALPFIQAMDGMPIVAFDVPGCGGSPAAKLLAELFGLREVRGGSARPARPSTAASTSPACPGAAGWRRPSPRTIRNGSAG